MRKVGKRHASLPLALPQRHVPRCTVGCVRASAQICARLDPRALLCLWIQMARSALDVVTDTGAFNLSPSIFWRSVSRDASARFPVVPGRYHLYVSYACP
jgi:hypothetical protein